MKKVLVTLSVFILSIVLTGCTESQISQYNELKEKNPELAQQLVDKYGEPTLDSAASADVEESNSQFDSTSKFVPQKNLQLNKSTSASISEEEIEVEEEVEEVEVKPSYEELVIGEVAVGNTVFFGRYEQDNNLDNGPEAIEWRVLSIEDGKATLVPSVAIMVGGLEDIHTLPQELYSDGFTDYEKELIVQFNDVIDSAFLSSYAGYIGSSDRGMQTYGQSINFTFVHNQSESVKAHYGSAVFLSGVTPAGDVQSRAKFWTAESLSEQFDSSGGKHCIWQRFDLTSSEQAESGWGTINPYIVIETNNNDNTLSVASVEAE